MTELFTQIRAAFIATVILALICCGMYPLLVFGIGQLFFRDQADGSLLSDRNRTVVGSRLLAQGFTDSKYFHSRPSAAGNGYDAANSGASNLGPTSQKLNDAIKDRIAAYRTENALANDAKVPADAVTASGSGLDPHISLQNAELQIGRVAKARGLSEGAVRELVQKNTDRRDLGFLGEAGVNVLKLNLALDRLR